jgi:hypothetical protein
MSNEEIRGLLVYKGILNELIKEVIKAAEIAKVSPKGFKIDESFCDYNEISVTNLVDKISFFSNYLLKFYKIQEDVFVDLITMDITEDFIHS